MAVQHGYGKMAGANSLVFAYDTGDTRNSYKGKPTTNLATLDLGNWINEGGVRTLLDQTYLGNPVYRWKSNPGQIWISPFAWNSNFDLTSNDMTVSAYFYNQSGNTETVGMYFGKDFSTDDVGNPNYRSIPVDGKWHKHSWTMYANAGYSNYLEFRTSSDTMLITTPMVEYGRIASQPVEGTRSATEGLIDLTGTTSIDLSNVSFDSDAMFQFDGTDDRIIFPPGSFPTIGTNDFTLEFVCKNTRTDRYNHFFSVLDQYHISFKSYNVDGLLYVYRTSPLSTTSSIPAYIPSRNDYYHIVAKRQGDNMQIYINGESQGLKTGWGDVSIDNNLYNSYIGWGAGTEYSGGHYAIAKIYNKALTDAEVSANFNNYKTRFNIA